MPSVHDTNWVLCGLILGTGGCLLVGGQALEFAVFDAVSLASVIVFALLFRSLQDPSDAALARN